MMTRKALARQEETKLQMTLRELKATKEKCDQLSAERDDNERELLDVLNKNDKLKKELAQLHSQYSDALDARDSLQLLVDNFDICRDEYEQTLQRITFLERQLYEANCKITDLEAQNNTIVAASNQSLYDELVATSINSATVNNKHPSLIIDLTCDNKPADSNSNSVRVIKCSRKKLKKYIKIKKFINKTKKLVGKYKFFMNNMTLKRQSLQLIDQVNMYSVELDSVSLQYNKDTQALRCEIDRLHESLKTITVKYEMALKQSREQVLAIGELVNSCNCNIDQSYSDKCNHTSDCMHSLGYQSPTSSSSSLSANSSLECKEYSRYVQNSYNITMFSDEIGKGMGSLISKSTAGYTVTNHCWPNLSYCEIINKIKNCNINENSTVVIFVGKRGNVNKQKFINYFEELSNLNVKKIVMFAFPLSKGLPQEENTIRHNLNTLMHNLTCQINGQNYDKFDFIDTNKFVRKHVYMTKGSYYLATYFKRQIAASLSYIFYITAKNLATKLAFIEQNADINNSAIEIMANNNDISFNCDDIPNSDINNDLN